MGMNFMVALLTAGVRTSEDKRKSKDKKWEPTQNNGTINTSVVLEHGDFRTHEREPAQELREQNHLLYPINVLFCDLLDSVGKTAIIKSLTVCFSQCPDGISATDMRYQDGRACA